MPELPEVETVVRRLRPLLVGAKLKSSKYHDAKLRTAPLEKFVGTVTAVRRSGKNILVDFNSGSSISFHLRMTGNLLWEKRSSKNGSTQVGGAILNHSDEKHLRCRLNFDRGELRFVDIRRFGTVELIREPKAPGALPIDPIEDPLDADILAKLIGSSRQQIKVWLLRQDRLVGIGNIYASEILFSAKISPFRAANSLEAPERKRLVKSTLAVLQKAIQRCGTTFSDFHDPDGASGSFQNFLKVYDREDKSCRSCRTSVARAVQAQRSTYYCPKCQD